MTRARDLAPQTVARLLIDTLPWLSCDGCFERIDSYAEARAFGRDTGDRTMDVHLRGCPSCAEEAESLIALLRETTPPDVTGSAD